MRPSASAAAPAASLPARWLRSSRVALALLTRLPVGPIADWRPGDLAAGAAWFPIVGMIVGAAAALVHAVATWFGLPPWPAAILAIGAMVLVAGGLHEDGLADFADAQGGRDAAARLAIMRDSRLGSFGALALMLSLMLRTSLVASLASPALVAPALLAAASLSRGLLPGAMRLLPPARADGLAASAGQPAPLMALAALLVAAAAGLLLLAPVTLALALGLALVASALIGAAAKRQLGGLTGDVLGAMQQLAEIAVLVAAVARTAA